MFFENSVASIPVLTPFWVRFKKYFKSYHTYFDSFVVGEKMVILPYLDKKRELEFPPDFIFYDFTTGETVNNKNIEISNSNTLYYVIGGSIIPMIPNPK